MRKILSEADFLSMLQCPKALVYLLVEWSGPERESRNIVYKALSEIPERNLQAFEIDCSNDDKDWVIDWLLKNGEEYVKHYVGGWGETFFVEHGQIVSCIQYPFKQPAELRAKLHEWNNQPLL